ncbi:MAG: preprotein translocase subunit SecA [bacterium]|nr:preprotein translocase subunit SecA [bacterium]
MLKSLSRLVMGDYNQRVLKRLSPAIQRINQLEPRFRSMPAGQLRAITGDFRARLGHGETLEDLLPEAFAAVREASVRVLGQRPFDVQLLGGIVLHQGNIAEMKTGEGKTLAATLPAYLNALEGKGVHVVTVNDYLARRDAEWMGQIYRFLGLSVGLIVHGLDYGERQASYRADITYGTNNEFGFDYLRDNMVDRVEHMVQRPPNYAIVDEVDSILVDEARTPLIISGQAEKSTDLYYQFARIVPRLREGDDYTVEEKAHSVAPTEEGVARVEKMLAIENLSEDTDLFHHLYNALKAHVLMKRDHQYVVKDDEIIIVDDFTGRLMLGRRYSDGLHQAIEAKEGVKIRRESQTLATITLQNYFRMYRKLAGMTGTAATEEEEFRRIYGMDVVVIPTNEEMIRVDNPDLVYRTHRGKLEAVAEEIVDCHRRGQPVLVGTISIERSEELSDLLRRRGAPHQVLNAKHHDREAEIIAQAGRKGSVTIATNMAGRGTDIMLGGNPEYLARQRLRAEGYPAEVVAQVGAEDGEAEGEQVVAARERYRAILREMRAETDREHEEVVRLGGLHVIGTERHEARRIDNQLRGRAGRQGDPGSSRFYIALDDDLMRLFGSDNISGILERLGLEEDQPIEHGLITRAIENAQKKVEGRNFSIRRHVLEYDDVMNKQREVIYEQRREVLTGENLRATVVEFITGLVDRMLDLYCSKGMHREDWDLRGLIEYAETFFLPSRRYQARDFEGRDRDELREQFLRVAMELYEARERDLGLEMMRELERMVMLRVVDQKWMDHLDAMTDLREGVGLRAYGQQDPLIEYKREAFEMFQDMIQGIQEDTVRYLYRVSVVRQPRQRRAVAAKPEAGLPLARAAGGEDQARPATGVRADKKVGRNAPCPCGSGKKYKKCCGGE